MRTKMMWIICCGPRSHQISTQLNTYVRFWTDVLDSTLHQHHQNTKWENIFWKNDVHSCGRVQRVRELMWRRIEAVLTARGGHTLCCFFLWFVTHLYTAYKTVCFNCNTYCSSQSIYTCCCLRRNSQSQLIWRCNFTRDLLFNAFAFTPSLVPPPFFIN